MVLIVGAALAVACSTWSPGTLTPSATPQARDSVVVFVPGMTGTQLAEPASGKLLWGATRQLFFPRDGGYSLALPIVGEGESSPVSALRPLAPILEIGIPGFRKPIYRPVVERLVSEGRTYGRLEEPHADADFFFFNYDWRQDNLAAVMSLDRQLASLDRERGGDLQVDLVCQSNAAKICRYLTKYGAVPLEQAATGEFAQREYEIRRVVLAGSSNGGSLRVLELLATGRSYVPWVGRKLRPETFFTLRPLFDDLPLGRSDLFIAESGATLNIDLLSASTWRQMGWSVFGRAESARADRPQHRRLFGTVEDRLHYLQAQLDRARTLHDLLQRDSPFFPRVAYFRLENESTATVDRALVRDAGNRKETIFPSKSSQGSLGDLMEQLIQPGDGHATIASQRQLSPQENAVLEDAKLVTGGHFEMVVQEPGLDALVAFLRQP